MEKTCIEYDKDILEKIVVFGEEIPLCPHGFCPYESQKKIGSIITCDYHKIEIKKDSIRYIRYLDILRVIREKILMEKSPEYNL